MPINSTLFIAGSVGAGGRNDKPDVAAVQQRLNDLMHPPRVPLAVDGLSGPKTVRMIRDFQKNAAGFTRGDGRVDPGGKTHAALNDPESEGRWARMSIPPQADLQPRRGAGAALNDGEAAKHEALHVAVANATQDADYTQKVIDDLLKNYGTAVKAMIATLGSSKDFLEIARAIKLLKDIGFSPKQVSQWIGVLLKNRSAPMSVALLREMGKNGSDLAPKLKALGRPMVVLSVLVTAVECYSYYQKGEYGAAAGEIYKLGMGIAVPWAALLDAVQSIIEGMAPWIKGNAAFEAIFKLLRAINPLAAGAVAVDSVVTLVQMTVEGVSTGKVNMSALNKLVNRMKSGPLSIFAEFGEFLGDTGYDFYEWVSS